MKMKPTHHIKSTCYHHVTMKAFINLRYPCKLLILNSGPPADRTRDTLIKSQVLYH